MTSPPSFDVASIGRLALVAGEGAFPLLLARSARDRGVRVFAYGLKGVTSDEIQSLAEKTTWLEFGKLQKLIDRLHEDGITHLTMAGRVRHESIFDLLKFDMRAVKLLGRLVDRRADSLLLAGVAELEGEGVRVIDSTIFLRSMMPPAGRLTSRPPSKEVLADVAFGHGLAKAVAGLDVGQTVVVKDRAIVAVEAMEGTDACIERAGQVAGPGCVVVKVSKPRQDRRFDVPVVGLTTVRKLVAARAAALAFSGGETLFFDREEAVALAEREGIAILGLEAPSA